MRQAPHAHPQESVRLDRRQALATVSMLAGFSTLAPLLPSLLSASELVARPVGPSLPDITPQQVSEHVWMIFAEDGFPTVRNQGMMSNIFFVVTRDGVVVLDSGSSMQIGQMAIRMIRTVTERPVVAVFNSHFHGDHWLGNQAFAEAFGSDLPIYALQPTMERIQGYDGTLWQQALEQWTEHATAGTVVVAPNRAVEHGQTMSFGDVTLRMHFYGHAHTAADLSVEVIEDQVSQVGDIAMGNRIANMDDGSYPGTFAYYDALSGAVADSTPLDQVKALVLQDPRVASRAGTMQGFDDNIGKYTSLAYLEAEREAF